MMENIYEGGIQSLKNGRVVERPPNDQKSSLWGEGSLCKLSSLSGRKTRKTLGEPVARIAVEPNAEAAPTNKQAELGGKKTKKS